MPFSIKKNDLFISVSHYRTKGDGLSINNDRLRNYKYEAGMRAKASLIEYVLNNDFNYFITITFDSKKQNRYDYGLLLYRVRKWFKNFQYRYDKDLKYIIVPELHDKKSNEERAALHIHGLIKLNNTKHLKKLTMSDYKKRKIKYDPNIHIYKHDLITKAYGEFNDFTLIYNRKEFIAYYITKYIGKQINGDKLSKQRYYSSMNLKKSEKITVNEFDTYGVQPDYENQFCTKWKFNHEEFKKIYLKEWSELNE